MYLQCMFRSSVWRPSVLFCKVFTRVGGWCRWISGMLICMCQYTCSTGGTFVCSPECGGGGGLIVYQCKVLNSYWLSHHHPASLPNSRPPVAAHLDLLECLMYPWINDIFYAQAPLGQVSSAHDLSLCCYLTPGYVVNLTKFSLIPSLVHR